MKKIIISLIILILFSSCSQIVTSEKRNFCDTKLSEFSNATKVHSVYYERGYVGCSDGFIIKWYWWDFYDGDNEFRLPLYEN